MAENSIFAILLRSPWWISIAVAAAIFAAVRLAVPAVYAFFIALPFAVIGCYAAWRQLREPSAQRVAQTLDALRTATWEAVAAALEDAFAREGYAVERIADAGADFVLTKAGRASLVACKRWKAARTGIEPLRELQAAAEAREVRDGIYIAAGEVTANALAFAAGNGIRVVRDAELAKLLRESALARPAQK